MRLLIVGSGLPELETAARIAAERGATVRQVRDLDAAMRALRDGHGADLLLVDVGAGPLGGGAVREAVERLAAERVHLPVVAYGIDADPRAAVAAVRAGACEFLPLPPDPELIAALLEAAGAPSRELVCEDPLMRDVLDTARRFAPTDACIMVTGESGTGKEMVARFLHAHSRRTRGPFVAVNCAAIPENLLESELFGHEKGAFTGAVARRVGKFEEADGGTLLLDEVTEMDPRLQAKLLRAVQEREIDRVGGTRPVRVDIRVIATSNRDLDKAVAEGGFREDLLFRLSVLTLRLPPLRDRPSDVEALARHFARKIAAANGLPPRSFSDAAVQCLLRHPWRGNVRELENCVHRAVVLARGPRIEVHDLMLAQAARITAAAPAVSAGVFVGRTVDEVERTLIIDTLRHTLGNRTHAATLLGISIRTLRNKLRQYSGEGMAVPPPSPAELGA
ncbi:MAG TPA: sigma-54 dependent transcriptional regulator [Geminicoccaceae bacterium]